MYNIREMSQEDIELQATRKFVTEQLLVEVDIFYSETQDEAETRLMKLFPHLSDSVIEDIILQLLYVVGRLEENEVELFNKYKSRRVTASDMILSFSSTKVIQLLAENDMDKLFSLSAQIIIELDDIFYDLERHSKEIGKNEIGEALYVTDTFMTIGFGFIPNKDLVPMWQHFMLPLIEKPNNWSTDVSGGYHTLEQTPILNDGEISQPNEVLEVLNTLQQNKYRIHKDTTYEDYVLYKTQNAMEKAKNDDNDLDYYNMKQDEIFMDEEDRNKILYTVTSFDQTLSAMKNKEFYFEWKFDFRGRLYETSYNISNQGDKYQKGMIIPAKSNFKGV